MPKSICLGNGSLLIGLDEFGQVKDFYYHYPGLENHVSEHLSHKIGVLIEEEFSWLDDGSWNIKVECEKDTLASKITAERSDLGIELHFNDIVYNERNVFIREIVVKNIFDRKRKVKLFFNQQFNISQTHTGDTAYFDPREEVMIHYKGRRVFLINAIREKSGFDEFSVGLLGIEGKAGTYKDAEDGELSGNGIEHGQVDSVMSLEIDIKSKDQEKIYYWICTSKSIEKAKKLNSYVLGRHPASILKTTKDYWKAWVGVQNFSFYGLGPPIIDLFNKSLFYIRTHVAKNGAIIASGDSDMLQFGRDTYAYVWPRDAAFSAIALERAGDFNASRRFFTFCRDTISHEGYFMHKYRPDKSLGSSWHPWIKDERKQFPIQEDETALVIYAFWKHYELSRDLEFIESMYNPLIKKAADFMVSYRDDKTGLPSPSYDLWEQDYGIHTFTACAVYGALNTAGRFAELLGKTDSAGLYYSTAEGIKKGILKYMYDESEGLFYKTIYSTKNRIDVNSVIDMSSVYGIFKFEVLEGEDKILKKAMDKTIEKLSVGTDVGGIARYEGDIYHHKGGNYPGNPWIITAMWVAQYYVSLAKKESDMEPVRKWISWVVKNASLSGILPEQYDPYTGEHMSTAPLTWSHAEFVNTIISYLEKLEELGICEACYPIA